MLGPARVARANGEGGREAPRVIVGLLHVGRDGAAARRLPRRRGARAPHVRGPRGRGRASSWRSPGESAGFMHLLSTVPAAAR